MDTSVIDVFSELGRRLAALAADRMPSPDVDAATFSDREPESSLAEPATQQNIPPPAAITSIIDRAVAANPWFSPADIRRAATALAADMLSRSVLSGWLAHYPALSVTGQSCNILPNPKPRTVLIIMAGNIPFVGVQDLICVLAAGCRAIVKPSSKDTVLMSWVVRQLSDIAPDLPVSLISTENFDLPVSLLETDTSETPPFPDAVIAMGGDETVAAIRAQYRDVPLLLRGHRSSLAVLDGRESPEQLAALANDVLSFSGLGCRNVSLVFVPHGYDFSPLQNALSPSEHKIALNPKYLNNYRSSRALLRMNSVPHFDTDSCLLVEECDFPNSVSVLNYSFYDRIAEVTDWLRAHDSEIQCVATNIDIAPDTNNSLPGHPSQTPQATPETAPPTTSPTIPRTVAFGHTQRPTLADYPDGRDTMRFLLSLSARLPLTPTLVVVTGPTGSGKTDLAVALASRFGAPIISTDSRQVYRGMKIGSAQPSDEQLAAVSHYFIADRPPTERFTCADFEHEALALLDTLFATHKIVIAAGGSGLYIDALTDGLDTIPDVNPEIRDELTNKLSREGLGPLLDELRTLDPEYYETVDRQNPARIVRALEVSRRTGRPFSSLRTGPSLRVGTINCAASPLRKKNARPFDIIKIGVTLPRPELYLRIDSRVDAMIDAGLEAEAHSLYPLRHLPALQTVGYREMFEYFDNPNPQSNLAGTTLATPEDDPNPQPDLDSQPSLAHTVELIKRNSRRYAKRQMTWFRRDPEIHWFTSSPATTANPTTPYNLAEIIAFISDRIKNPRQSAD